jgi:hypothetical protein
MMLEVVNGIDGVIVKGQIQSFPADRFRSLELAIGDAVASAEEDLKLRMGKGRLRVVLQLVPGVGPQGGRPVVALLSFAGTAGRVEAYTPRDLRLGVLRWLVTRDAARLANVGQAVRTVAALKSARRQAGSGDGAAHRANAAQAARAIATFKAGRQGRR